MAKPNVPQINNELNENLPECDEAEAFEMIELAISDIDLLTKAFSMISDVCAEEQSTNLDQIEKVEIAPERVLH